MCDWCAVISEGRGWGCNSQYGEDIMNACYYKLVSANMTGVSNEETCRQVMQFYCKIRFIHFVCVFFLVNNQ